MDLHDRCQNRARQHRLYTLSAQRWQDLSALLPPVFDPGEHAQIVRGIYARRADALMDALLAGFDLGLIEKEEWSPVYWFLWCVAEERAAVEDGSRTWRTSWARAWANAAKALHLVCLLPAVSDLHSHGSIDYLGAINISHHGFQDQDA